MKIGILADIHGQAAKLRQAIERLQAENVDRIVGLGDLIYDPNHAAEIVDILTACRASCLFGNHELGLCVDPPKAILDRHDDEVIEYFGSLPAQIEIGDVLCSHTFPPEDATDPISYYLGQTPEDTGAWDASFAQFPHRIMLIGHFHRWYVGTPAGQVDWNGVDHFELDPTQRYCFVIAAVMDGCAAALDTESNILTPIRF